MTRLSLDTATLLPATTLDRRSFVAAMPGRYGGQDQGIAADRVEEMRKGIGSACSSGSGSTDSDTL